MVCARCSTLLPEGANQCPRCGSAPTLDLAAEGTVVRAGSDPGSQIPRRFLPPGFVLAGTYRIDEVIGEGGMSVVYRAWDLALDRWVAVKALHANLLGDHGIRHRFMREASILKRLSHPNVATVYDTIHTDDVVAMVLELVHGPTLREQLQVWRNRLPWDELRQVALGMLDAVQAAHDHGIVHRDLKPGNILLERVGGHLEAKVIDFGIAKVLEGTTYTMTGALLGTCRYMSPEQVQSSQEVDYRSDVYSAGVVLYEMACGKTPFDEDNHFSLMMSHVTQEPPPPSSHRDDLPDGLQDVLLDCLRKAPADRPQSCRDVRDRLAAILPVGPEVDEHAQIPPEVERSLGAVMVLVPAGGFLMGAERRDVYLDGVYIDRFPVTNAQFAQFVEVTGYRPADSQRRRFLAHWHDDAPPKRLADHPVVYVSWLDAQAYATWAGLRLPTEAEWEKAARGTDGRQYPWGRDKPNAVLANFGGRGTGTTPVHAHPDGASPFGVHDLAGNVWEWCADVDDPDFYRSGPTSNPRSPLSDGPRVVRGGAWTFADARSLRTFSRAAFDPTYRLEMVGFRCARSAS